MRLDATFDIVTWEETPVEEWEGGKLTRASIVKRYAGGIEGEARQEYLMSYAADGSATFVGLERVQGSAGGRAGTLVLQQVGRFVDGAARASLAVVGAGGDLAGSSGSGEMVADPAGRVTLELTVA